MNNKVKLIKMTGYTLSITVIIFSMKFLAPNHERLVLPVLFGTMLIIIPLENYVRNVEKKKTNLSLRWAIFIITIIGFVWFIIVFKRSILV